MSEQHRVQDAPLVVGLGEILWDLLPQGPVLGGAPANFACRARRLGARAALISAVGADPLGDRARGSLGMQGIDHSAVASLPTRPTGTAQVDLNREGEPAYRISEGAAWDFIPTTPAALALASSAHALCYGTLALRGPVSRATILALIEGTEPTCLRVFDVNLRRPWIERDVIALLLERSDVVKVNDAELQVLAELLDFDEEEDECVEQLAALYSIRLVAVTKGAAGCRLFAEGRHVVHPGFSVREIVDTVGAGDAFTAALVLGMCQGLPLTSLAETSNRVASDACRHSGASAGGTTSIGTVP